MCRILEHVLAVTPQGYLTFSPSAKVSPKVGLRVTENAKWQVGTPFVLGEPPFS